jgi:large subunit ribosomal protein L25
MKSVALNAFPRTLARRAGAKQLRSSGRIPAVIYGRQAQPQSLEVDGREFSDLIKNSASENLLLDLAVKEDARPKRLALLQEVQHHPLSGKVLHVDLHEVAEDEKVTISVPVETSGEAEGVKTDGGVLEHVLFKIKARGLPKDLPELFVVDVTALKIGQAIHLGEIPTPAGVELVGDKTVPVIAVSAPRTEEEEAAATAEGAVAAGEVEMIKEKKEEGEEGAPAKPGAAAKPGDKAAAAPKAGEKAAAAPAGDKKAAPAGEKKK